MKTDIKGAYSSKKVTDVLKLRVKYTYLRFYSLKREFIFNQISIHDGEFFYINCHEITPFPDGPLFS